uniref:Uncharacterized protein n=1 Tax=Cuerna arida TaxID=1464854 RepID=A0A1B6F784_9HEMI
MSQEIPAPTKRKLMKADLKNRLKSEDKTLKRCINDLKSVQAKINALDEKAYNEKQATLIKHDHLKRPFFQERSKCIKKIPNFWATVFTYHTQISSLVSEEVEDCLKYLTNFEVEEGESARTNFKINFFFKENPFIENEQLTKEVSFKDNMECTTNSTQIVWKKKIPLKGRKATIPPGQKRKFEEKNFFEWFEDNEDFLGEVLAETFRTEIWQNPVPYFKTGLMIQEIEEDITSDEGRDDHDGDSTDDYDYVDDDVLKELLKEVADSDNSSDDENLFDF